MGIISARNAVDNNPYTTQNPVGHRSVGDPIDRKEPEKKVVMGEWVFAGPDDAVLELNKRLKEVNLKYLSLLRDFDAANRKIAEQEEILAKFRYECSECSGEVYGDYLCDDCRG